MRAQLREIVENGGRDLLSPMWSLTAIISNGRTATLFVRELLCNNRSLYDKQFALYA